MLAPLNTLHKFVLFSRLNLDKLVRSIESSGRGSLEVFFAAGAHKVGVAPVCAYVCAFFSFVFSVCF